LRIIWEEEVVVKSSYEKCKREFGEYEKKRGEKNEMTRPTGANKWHCVTSFSRKKNP
jgi:hypothetical protein